jgi:hypothetical protein
VLEGNQLPPGRYLLVVTLRGSANWDRQVGFFQVDPSWRGFSHAVAALATPSPRRGFSTPSQP